MNYRGNGDGSELGLTIVKRLCATADRTRKEALMVEGRFPEAIDPGNETLKRPVQQRLQAMPPCFLKVADCSFR
jgi:hypothetical protein